MTPHVAHSDSPSTRYIGRPACPRCGDTLLAPIVTEFAISGHIRHTWTCEVCEHKFRTAVQIPDAA